MADASIEKEKSRSYRIVIIIWLPLLIVLVLPFVVAIVLGGIIRSLYLDDMVFRDVLGQIIEGIHFLREYPVQIIEISLVHGSVYALAGVGLTMTYRILKFANFAHAELITFGAYAAYILNVDWGGLSPGISLLLGVILAFFLGGLLGIGCDTAVYKHLRKKEAESMSLMIASIGVGYIIRHVIQQRYGSAPIYYNMPRFELSIFGQDIDSLNKSFLILGARMTLLHLIIIVSAIVMVIILHLLLTHTTLGKAMRATADNPILAQAAGIHTERIIRVTWFVGAGAAAIGGCLRAADTRLAPILGFQLLLLIFAVVILGGIGSFYGCILAAYIIGFAESIGVILLGMVGVSTEYRQAMAFIVLIIVLLIHPTGLLGLKEPGVGEE
ncbi:MAG: branched-chain amino acid ABC transporter permease [Candidatus Heimdallarchaeota archaeon]